MFRSFPLFSTLGLSAVALVACNQPPPEPSVSITPEAPTTIDNLTATFAEVEDPNGNDVVNYGYTWEVLAAGSPDTEEAWREVPELTGGTVAASLTEKGQSWRVTVTASDGTETVSSDQSAAVAVLNSLPEITSVRLSPGKGVDTFGILNVNAAATDTDGDPVEISYVWLVNGTPVDFTGQTLTGEYFGKGDVVTVEATANDGESSGEAVVSNAVTIDNSGPRIDAVVISPELIVEDTEILCSPVGWYDPDEDTPDVQARWLVNGAEVAGVTGPLTGEYFGKGDLIRCEGRPFDGEVLGDVVVSDVVQVGNTPPSVDSVTLSNTSPKAADALTFNPVGAVDVDGDEIIYSAQWYVDGEMVADGQELPSGSFIKGQEVYAIVTPSDGLAVGEPVTSEIGTAVNTPPEIIEISMSPAELYTDSVAFPGVIAVDLDGDPVTYKKAWTVNGTSAGVSGATLDGNTYFDKSDVIQVTLTPNDGEDDGAPLMSDSYTILNSPPTQPLVLIDVDKPKPDDDLWCELITDSTDADGDDLEKTLTWERNGSAFTDTDTLGVAGDYVDAEYTEDYDTFTCTYTVTDGTATVTSIDQVDVLLWTGTREFEPCGASGFRGPSQNDCDTFYEDELIEEEGVTVVDDGWQEWTVPLTGTYRIEAKGAAGGTGRFGSFDGHRGARIRGDFDLEAGDVLKILVGQEGGGSTGSYATGGGGATWVREGDGTVLMTAAGGGANGYNYTYASTCGGQAGTSARRNFSTSTSAACTNVTRTAGEGGTYHSVNRFGTETWNGGGGAGLNGDGEYYSTACNAISYSANDASNPGRGGDGVFGDGGFGGGGCGGAMQKYSWSSSPSRTSTYGAGGGGGYTGGDAGYYKGGGGSSYNTGANASSSSDNNAGNGSVTIDLLPPEE